MGNDFLPPMSYLNIRDNGIERVIDAYTKSREECGGQSLIDAPTATINATLLSHIAHRLASNEDVNMIEACATYYGHCTKQRPSAGAGASATIDFRLDNLPSFQKFPKSLINPAADASGWRDAYYKHLCYDADPASVAQSYIKGIYWVADYYFKRGNASKSWYYKYSYSPVLTDFAKALDNHKVDLDALPTIQVPFYMQLLMVLPPRSKSIVNPKIRPLMTDVKYGCAHMYPTRFQVNTFLKTYLWECSPALPEIDMESLIKASDGM
jgi:5'-3' exonuclease